MSLLRDFIELITVYPGALVYHLVTLFAIQLIAGVAVGHWQRRRRDEDTPRLLLMAVGFFLAQTLLMIIAVLDALGLVSSTVVVPPLERFLHLITSLLVVWAFLPISRRDQSLSTLLLLVAALAAAGAYAAFAAVWPAAEAQGISYNGHWQERIWELSTTAILSLAFIASLVWRGPDWGWLACLLALWLTGHVFQILAPTPAANASGWIRLANLAGLPLLAALVFRRALQDARHRVSDPASSPPGAARMLEAVQRIRSDGSMEPGLELAVPAIAGALHADMAAGGVMASDPEEALRVVALHPPRGEMIQAQAASLLLSEHPLLAAAFHGQCLERADGNHSPFVDDLYRHLGFDASGPLLVQPLVAGEAVTGLILLGNPESQQAWDAEDERLVETLAQVLTAALGGDSGLGSFSKEQLGRVREEAQQMASRVESLEDRLERHRQRSEELSTKLRLREAEAGEQERASAALAVWQEEVQALAEARDALQIRLFDLQSRAERLSQAKAELEERLEQVRSAGDRSVAGGLAGILVSDEGGAILLASRNTEHLLARSPADLATARLQDIFDEPSWRDAIDTLLDGSRQPGEVTSLDLRLGKREVRADLTRLHPSEHWPGTLVALFYTLTERALNDAEVNALVGELRGPVTSIASYTDQLLSEQAGILGESQRHVLLGVEADIQRLETLLNKLIEATAAEIDESPRLTEPARVPDGMEESPGNGD